MPCAYYNLGGEGVAHHDFDAKNNGSGALNPADGTYLNQLRMHEGVDTSYTKFHDQIDKNPYNLVQPPETSSTLAGPNQENGSTSPFKLRKPAFIARTCCTHPIVAGSSRWT